MPTRLNSPQISTSSSSIKRQQLRSLVLGAATGFVVAMSGSAVADGELQLQAPLNSTLTISTAEKNWIKRTPDANKTPSLPAEKSTNSQSGSVTAQTASSPLDRIGNPLAKLPSMKLTPQAKTSGLGQPAVQLPGERVLDQMTPPPLPGANGWVGRSAGNRMSTTAPPLPRAAASVASGDSEADGFRPPVVEGNWIARDAINRIEPLRDPSQTARPQPQSRISEEAYKSANTAVDTSETPLDSKAASNQPSAKPEPQRVVPEFKVPTAKKTTRKGDNFAPRSKSMSLDEAQSIQEVSPDANEPSAALEKSETKPPQRDASTNQSRLGTPTTDESKADDKHDLAEKTITRIQETKAVISAKASAENEATPTESSASKKARTRQTEEKPSPAKQVQPTEQVQKSLPKRKPLENLADVGTSSVKKKTEKVSNRNAEKVSTETQKPAPSAAANSSVGDLNSETESPPVLLDYTGHAARPVRPGRTVSNMRTGIERTLRYFYDRPEVANGRSNWGMMHSMMVFGVDTKVIVGRQRYSTIAWIAGNNNCRGQRLLTNDADGIQAKSGVGLQGHQGQFLAVLGMCNVPTSYPLHVSKTKYSVADLIESEKRACKKGVELTFTLIGLSHYLDTDTTWTADDGTEWSFERLIAEELKQPIVGAACGGTHRLMGYTHALRKRRAEGKPITGHWKRAETYTQDFIRYAYSLQNRDGSMSTKWFEGRADNGDTDRKIQTTGHIVEWLLTVTPDDQLQERRLVAAVNYLYRAVGSDLRHDWSIGPKGHALRSLAMYHQRVFKMGTPWIPESIARANDSNSRR